MGNQIELLIDLQVIDGDLRTRSEAISNLRNGVQEIEDRIASERSALAVCDTERAPLDTRRREVEAILADEQAKMTDRRMRLNRVRNEKEAAAIRREIEVAKEATDELEKELLDDEGLYTLLKTLNERAAEMQETIAGLESQRDAEQTRVDDEVARISASMGESEAKRASVASGIDGVLRKRYEAIFARCRGLAVVEVQDGTCVGCHMSIAPQMANEIRRAQQVITCPNCHRILYFKSAADDSEE